MKLLFAVTALLCGASEFLGNLQYRAVTLEPKQRKLFSVPDLNRITLGTGKCVDESPDETLQNGFSLEAVCSGLRTTMVWKKDGTRVHVMACAEEDPRPPAVLSLRVKVQKELTWTKMATACVRNGRVEVWGWAKDEAEKKRIDGLAKKHGDKLVRSFVEIIDELPN